MIDDSGLPDDGVLERLWRLEQIERLKLLKARYFRFVDTKQWDSFAELFTEDVEFLLESDLPTVTGRDVYVEFIRARLGTATTVHQGHTPEITFGSATEAHGIWGMYDWVDDPDHRRGFVGFGHYHEDYRLGDDGEWRIRRVRTTRLRVDVVDHSIGPVNLVTPAPH